MENSILKNKIAPWQEKGRWFKFFVESDGTDYTLTSSEITGATIDGSYLKLPADYHAIEYVVDLNVDASAAATFEKGIRMYADGKQAVVLPAKTSIDYCTVYVFANVVD